MKNGIFIISACYNKEGIGDCDWVGDGNFAMVQHVFRKPVDWLMHEVD